MLYVYLGEGGECEVVWIDLPEEPVLRLVVVRRLVVPLIREPGPLRLQRLRLHLGLKTDGEKNSDGFQRQITGALQGVP